MATMSVAVTPARRAANQSGVRGSAGISSGMLHLQVAALAAGVTQDVGLEGNPVAGLDGPPGRGAMPGTQLLACRAGAAPPLPCVVGFVVPGGVEHDGGAGGEIPALRPARARHWPAASGSR